MIIIFIYYLKKELLDLKEVGKNHILTFQNTQ